MGGDSIRVKLWTGDVRAKIDEGLPVSMEALSCVWIESQAGEGWGDFLCEEVHRSFP